MRLLLGLLLILPCVDAAAATITTSYVVNDPVHVLNGATVSAVTTDVLNWVTFDTRIYADGSATTVTISGATGAGAAWNGTYLPTANLTHPFLGYGDTIPGPGGTVFGPTRHDGAGNSTTVQYDDGSGNIVEFRAQLVEGPSPPTDGSPVDPSNFQSTFTTLLSFRSVSGIGPSYLAPAGGSGTITFAPVPEPSASAMMGLGMLAVAASARRRMSLRNRTNA